MAQTRVFPKTSDFKKQALIYATSLEILPLCTTLLIFLLCQPLSSASTLPSKRFRSLPEDMIYNEFPGPERSKNIKKQQLSNLMQSNPETTLGERRLDNKTRSKRYSDVTKRRIQRNRDRMLSSKKSSKLSSSSDYYPYYASAYSSKGKGGTGKASSSYSNNKGGMVVPVLYISTTSVATSTSVDDNGTSSNEENSDDEDDGSDDAIDHDDETSDLFDFLGYSQRQPAALPTSSAPTVSPSQFPSFVPSSSIAPSKSMSITPSARLSQEPSASFQPSQSQKPSFSPSVSFGPSASMLPSRNPSASQNPTKSSAQPSTSFQPSTLPSSSPSIEPIVLGTATIKMKSQLFDTGSDNTGDENGGEEQNLQDIFFIGDHG